MAGARETSQIDGAEVVGVDPLGNLPRYALFRGKRARILAYNKGERRPFHILTHNDDRYDATREQLTFLPQRKKK